MVNIVICDDSKDYLEIIKSKIEKCMNEKILLEYNITCLESLEEFQSHIKANRVDIAFLDIMIEDTNSMDWSIDNIDNKYMQIIFITAFPQSAYNISETNCCYYLMKSKITDDNLYKAIQKALNNNIKKDPNLTIVKFGGNNRVIDFNEITYIEAQNNNLLLFLNNEDSVKIYSTLKDYLKTLPPFFLKCHKSYIVNMNYISDYEPYNFNLKTNNKVPIPPKKYTKVIKEFENYIKNI